MKVKPTIVLMKIAAILKPGVSPLGTMVVQIATWSGGTVNAKAAPSETQ